MAVIKKKKKQASTVQNRNEKRGENLLFWRSHSYAECDLQNKRFSSCFPISVRPAASTVFPNLALSVKSLPISALMSLLL